MCANNAINAAKIAAINTAISNEDSLRASIEKDFDYNYFIKAGAGAGKTSLVVNRITEQLKSGRFKPEEIAAITFTNKAAQELRQRITDSLRAVAAQNPRNSTINDALQNIGRMQISTIHSFCHRLLKENCFEAGLRLDFELLEEDDAVKTNRAFFREWFNNNSAGFKALKTESPDEITYFDLEDNFCSICDIPSRYQFKYEPLNKVSHAAEAQLQIDCEAHFKKAFDDFKSAINDELKDPATGPLKGLTYDSEKIKKYLYKNCYPENDPEDILESLSDTHCPFTKSGLSKVDIQGLGNRAFKKIEALYLQAHSERQTLDNMPEARTNTLILDFILPARAAYQKQHFNHFVSNDLLLQKANKLLDDPNVQKKIQKTFKCIYVDEFQDTDPIQNELVMKICQDSTGKFIKGMLFVVGDVKQSIYRFREADYRIFDDTERLFKLHPTTCKVEELNINNRSNSELVDYYNATVKGLKKNLNLNYKDMIPRQGYRSDDVIKGVYVLDETSPELESEPAQMVRLIHFLCNNVKITAYDQVAKKMIERPIQYSDFLILTRNSKGGSVYIDALQKAGIPAKIAVEYNPGQLPALKRFAFIYRYLATPYYDRAKEGILEIAQLGTSSNIYENIGKLEAFKEQTNGMGGAELAGWLLEHGEAYLYADTEIDASAIKRYQMAIRQMLYQVLSKCDGNPMEISRALFDYIDPGYSCDRELNYDKAENAVRLMNIHKSKGLEGNIVIIAQRIANDERDANYTIKNDRYQMVSVRGYFSKDYCSSYAINPTIKQDANLEVKRDNARLEYVAVTRAKEALIFMGALKKQPVFKDYVTDDIPEIYDEFSYVEDNGSTSVGVYRLDHAVAPDDKTTERAGYRISPSTMEISAPLVSKIEEEPTATPKAEEEDPESIIDISDEPKEVEEETETSTILQKRPSGDIFGTVMHRAFELVIQDMRQGSVNTDLCVNRAINENSDDIDARYKSDAENEKSKYQEYLQKKLPDFIRFFESLVRDADEVLTEYPFSLTVTGADLIDIKKKITITEKLAKILPEDGTENSKSVWINGKADLLIKKGDIITVWDYKSDKQEVYDFNTKTCIELSDEEFAEKIHKKYDNQMELYKWVFSKIFDCDVNGMFYSVETGGIPN